MEKVAGIILLVNDIGGSAEFYEKLGFEVAKEVSGTATTVRLGDFWLELLHKSKVVSEEYKEDVDSPSKGAGAYLQIQVRNVDDFYDKVANNGISPSAEPKDFPWNHREFIVIDPDGYKLAFFTPIQSSAEHNRQYWEDMYNTPIDDLPWEIKEAPAELREYIETHKISGGHALDAGCGTGNFSVYLAQKGFTVTGVDYSERAIAIAEVRKKNTLLPITYRRADLTKLADSLSDEHFDLILDYKVAHHLTTDMLRQYVGQCVELLKPHGRILLICYSDKDVDAAGGQSAVGKFGNTMFYRSADEVRKIYKGLKEISYKEVMLGKHLNHAGHCFVFEKTN